MEVISLADGMPYGIEKSEGLDDVVVEALTHYRFQRLSKPFVVTLKIPVRDSSARMDPPESRRLDFPEDGLRRRAQQLTEEQAHKLEANRPADLDEPTLHRLLAWFASQREKPLLAMQSEHVLWLVQNTPEGDLLSSVAAQVPPLAPGFEAIREEWHRKIAENPQDLKTIKGATLFLAPHEPQKVMEIVRPLAAQHPEAKLWLGEAYAYAALGPPSLGGPGWPTATPLIALPGGTEAKAARDVLLQSEDLAVLTSAHATIRRVGTRLLSYGQEMKAVVDFCNAVVGRIQQLAPATRRNCKLSVPRDKQSIASGMTVGKRVKVLDPAYPLDAKRQGIQGTVELNVLIGADGKIKDLRLAKGPFALYKAAADAVRKWEYEPYRLDGEPIEVFSAIQVNYTLGR